MLWHSYFSYKNTLKNNVDDCKAVSISNKEGGVRSLSIKQLEREERQ
jgi:hypothetical protein